MLKITSIQLDYMKHPVGLVCLPQISWVMESEKKNTMQAWYQIQIAANASFETVLWDSRKTESDESSQILPEGLELSSLSRYFVRVKAGSTQNEESDWSEVSEFITGILTEKEWEAEFISAETEADADKSDSTLVRAEFEIHGTVKEAFACTTALGLYHVYLNGETVGTDEMAPGWTSYHNRLLYQVNEITSYLKEGKNAMGAFLGAGWYKGLMGFVGNRNNYGKQTAFFGQILIRYEDGRKEVIVTNNSWKGSHGPVVFSEIYDGEIYDAGLEQPGWKNADFAEHGWKPVSVVPYDRSILVSQPGSRVTVQDKLPAIDLFRTPEGDLVLDFGQNLTGWIETSMQGKAGQKLQLQCFETLDAKGNVYLDNLRLAKEQIQYLCGSDEAVTYHPYFTFQGFRYARIDAFPGEPKKENFTAFAVHSQMEQTFAFSCSNQDINQLMHNVLWGLKGNFLDIPSDCPQRNERLGWTGDAQIFCRTASYLMNTHEFYAKWLKDVAADQMEDGGVPHVVPDIVTGSSDSDWLVGQGTHSAAAWADVAVINPWMMYITYGDKKILADQYESMKAWIDFMTAHETDGIWDYRLQFGDWVALDAEEGSYFGATPTDLTCTAYYAYSSELFARAAAALGRMEDYETYHALHERIKKVFQTHFFDSEGNMTAQTQTAHIVALHFNLVPEAYRKKTAARLVELLQKEGGHLVTGFIGTPYFCYALSENGCEKEAYELLLKDDFPSWLYQVKMGATTVWEHWDGLKPDGTMWSPDMNSFNHYAYGAVAEWLFGAAAGIRPEPIAAGYKAFTIAPCIGGDFQWLDASFTTIHGDISVSWKVETTAGGTEIVQLSVSVPANTKALIVLKQAKQMLEMDGLDFDEDEEGWCAWAGSGTWKLAFVPASEHRG